jgi:integrase/recombinase XerD
MKITKLGVAMKIDRHGQAKILTVAEIQLLFNEGFTVNPPRDRALFAICFYTACRTSEAVSLKNIVTEFPSALQIVLPILILA